MHRTRGQSDREFWQGQLGPKSRILECASGRMYGGTFYAAVETTHEDGSAKVWAFVCLTKWVPNAARWNYSYKDMSERMGPNEDECPPRVLDLLSPLEACGPHRDPGPDGFDYCGTCSARNWRERCRTVAANKARAAKVKAGQVVRFPYPVKFASGTEQRELELVGRDIFRADGCRYRISGWRAMSGWELVTS